VMIKMKPDNSHYIDDRRETIYIKHKIIPDHLSFTGIKMKQIVLLLLMFIFTMAQDTLYFGSKPFMILGQEKDLLLAKDGPQGPDGPLLDYFPDEGTTRMPSVQSSLNLLISGGISTWLLEGGNPQTFTSFKKITEVMKPVSTSSWENGYAGMSGTWVNSKGKVWGFYHAEDHKNLPNIPGTLIPGFYASVGAAVSLDSGKTWRNRQRLLVCANAKIEGDSAPADQGISEPGVVASADGRFVYIVYTDHSRINYAPVRICLARIPIEGDSLKLSECLKWSGTSFSLPSDGGRDVPVLSGVDIMGVEGDALEGHPVWCAKINRYLMPLGTYDYTSAGVVGMGGMWLVTSEDLVNWSTPVRFSTDWSLPFGGKSMRWEASIVWTNETSGTWWFVYGQTDKFPDENGAGEGAHMVGKTFRLLFTAADFQTKVVNTVKGKSMDKKSRLETDLLGRTQSVNQVRPLHGAKKVSRRLPDDMLR